jgi:dienelactone hydrolase
MGTTRRKFLGSLTAAAAAAPFAKSLLGLERSAAAQVATAPALKGSLVASIPSPLDEPIVPSHVGSLLGPITRIRDAYGWASESFASDKFKAADHPAWRKKMLAEVFDAMHYAPAKCEFAAETVERIDCGKFFREKIYFNTTPELRVPAYVMIPKDLTGKAPAIVALHDHGGFYRWGKEKLVKLPGEHASLTEFKECYANRSIADDLAEQGYIVIVIDLFYWGERRLRLPDDPKSGPDETKEDVRRFNGARGPMEQLVARTIFTSGFTWAGLIFWDDIRTVDYLASRPEVDANRIGCVGLSLGAWRANHLTALDERIKAGVAVCWLSSFKELQSRNIINTVGLTKLLPGLYRRLDMPDVVSLAAPRPLLCINGLKDGLFPVESGVKPAYRTLENVYAKIGAADKFRGHLYDSPHEFNADMQREAWDWLKKWI